MKKGNESKKGFTLIELTIYFGLLSIFILVLTEIFVSVLNTQLSSESTSSVAQDGRFIYSRLIYDINSADNVTLPANLGDTSDTLVLIRGGQTYTYSLSNGNLELQDPSLDIQPLNGVDTTISNFVVTRLGNAGGKHTFQINFRVTGNIQLPGGRVDTQVFQTTAGLR